MPAFEPSTWAEVEEAIISNKPSAQPTDPFVLQVRAFTHAPERFLTGASTPSEVGVFPTAIAGAGGAAAPLGATSTNNNIGAGAGGVGIGTTTNTTTTTATVNTATPAGAGAAGAPGAGAARNINNVNNNNNRIGMDSSKNARPPQQRPQHLRPGRALTTMKRNGSQFDDLLGHGRIDLDSESFIRRYAVPMNFKHLAMFPPQPEPDPDPLLAAGTGNTTATGIGTVNAQNNYKTLNSQTARTTAAQNDKDGGNNHGADNSTNNYTNSSVNPSSKAFNPTVYLSKIHVDSTTDQLQSGATLLKSVKQGLDARVDELCADKFIRAALVESAFESTKSSLKNLCFNNQNEDAHDDENDGNDGDENMNKNQKHHQATIDSFRNAEKALARTYDGVVQREAKLARLRRTLAVFRRCRWVFQLGGRLRKAATQIHEDVANVEDCVREYQRALNWLRIQREYDDDDDDDDDDNDSDEKDKYKDNDGAVNDDDKSKGSDDNDNSKASDDNQNLISSSTANNNGAMSTTRYASNCKPKRSGGTAAPCALDSIEQSIRQGFEVLFDAILTRLANGHSSKFKTMATLVSPTITGTTSSSLSSSKQSSAVPPPSSQQETARLVSVLMSVQREDILAKALDVRTTLVTDTLRRSIRSITVLPLHPTLLSLPTGGGGETATVKAEAEVAITTATATTTNEAVIDTATSTAVAAMAPTLTSPSSLAATPAPHGKHDMRIYTNLVLRLSETFTDGLDYVWSLGRVCPWSVVRPSIVRLCTAYAQLIRDRILPSIDDDASSPLCVVSVEAVRSIAATVRIAVETIGLGQQHQQHDKDLQALYDMQAQVVDVFLRTVAARVRKDVESVALHAIRTHTVGVVASQKILPIALAALTVLDADLLRAHTVRAAAAGVAGSESISAGVVANNVVAYGTAGAATAKRTRQQQQQQHHQQQQQRGDEDFDVGHHHNYQSPQSQAQSHSSLGSPGLIASNGAEMLSVACLESPCVFAWVLEQRILRDECASHGRSVSPTSDDMLRVAVCCKVLEDEVIPKIMHKACVEKLGRIRTLRYHGRRISEMVKDIGDEGLQRYLKASIGPIKKVAMALGGVLQHLKTSPTSTNGRQQRQDGDGDGDGDGDDDDDDDNHNVHSDDDDLTLTLNETMTLTGRKQPIRIAGVSKPAHELTLQMALVVVNTGRFDPSTKTMEYVLMTLIKSIGQTLLDMLSTHKLPYRYAAQLWVDVAFIQQVVTSGADSQCVRLLNAIDPFIRIQDRAVQAVVADGFGFSSADTQTLRDTVVAVAMNDAKIVTETFEENWAFVHHGDVDAEEDDAGADADIDAGKESVRVNTINV